MFENANLWMTLTKGGWVMVPLFLCSVLSLGIIVERWVSYRKNRIGAQGLLNKVENAVEKRDTVSAVTLCEKSGSSLGRVLKAGLSKKGKGVNAMRDAMEVQVREEVLGLEKYTGIVGTIGNVAPFIGLFGTVIGVIRAFNDIARAGGGGMNVVMNGIAEALVATAAGLFVAIPAVMGYNYLVHTIGRMETQMENGADLLSNLVEDRER